jgi:hypothetical protein
VLFRYRPHYWWLSLGIFTVTAAGIGAAFVRRRRGGFRKVPASHVA